MAKRVLPEYPYVLGELFLMVTLTILGSPTTTRADRIHLKHGDYVDVDTWHEENGMISYQRFGGTISISKEEVLRIEKRDSDPTMSQAPGSSRNPSAPVAAPGQVSSPAAVKVTPPRVSAPVGPRPAASTPPPASQGKASQGKAGLAAYWERQKNEALRMMDEHANAQNQCASRYGTKAEIATCQDSHAQWRRVWNERYIVATREYERYR